MRRSFADILGGIDAETERRTGRKLPSWTAVSASRRSRGLEPLEIPSALSLEQCSSEETAGYKRALLAGLFPDGVGTLCDLSCGLGIDSLAFSRISRKVIAYERSQELAQAAVRNFRRLGVDNIELRNEEVGPASELPDCDVIFADPARRDGAGRKLFRLEDCSPDVRPLLPLLLRKAGTLLLKLSPMADISLLAGELGESLEEVHIVSLRSEVKELLCLLRRGHTGTYTVTAAESGCAERFVFTPGEEREAEAAYCADPRPGQLLLEPRAALMKSGAYKLISSRFGIPKLAPSTHLYIGPAALPGRIDGDGAGVVGEGLAVASTGCHLESAGCSLGNAGCRFESAGCSFGNAGLSRDSAGCCGEGADRLGDGGGCRGEGAGWPGDGAGLPLDSDGCRLGNAGLSRDGAGCCGDGALLPGGLFKLFVIKEVRPFNRQNIKALARLYPDAEVSARNLPLSSGELQRKMGVKGGGPQHIFGCGTSEGRLLIVAETVRQP